jgi:hypothetical protein
VSGADRRVDVHLLVGNDVQNTYLVFADVERGFQIGVLVTVQSSVAQLLAALASSKFVGRSVGVARVLIGLLCVLLRVMFVKLAPGGVFISLPTAPPEFAAPLAWVCATRPVEVIGVAELLFAVNTRFCHDIGLFLGV